MVGPDLRQIPSPYMKQMIHVGGVYLTTHRLLVVIVGAIIVGILIYFVKYTSLGSQMRATAQNFQAATIVGINTDRVFALTFVIGAVLAGIAGALVGAMFVTEPTMGMTIIVKAFIVVIVGGMGSIAGSVVAGLGLGLVETIAGVLMPSEFIDIIGFSIMIIVLLTKPSGIFGIKGGRVRRYVLLSGMIFVACLLPLVFSEAFHQHIFITIVINSILAVSLGIVVGYLGELSLAHGAFFGIGAYTSALISINLNVPFFVALPLAVLFAGIMGYLIGIPALRLSGHYFAIATLGFQGIVILMIINLVDLTRGPMGLGEFLLSALIIFSASRSLFYRNCLIITLPWLCCLLCS